MIKSTELRIGNKLQKENGEIFTVLRLDNTNDVLVEEQRGLLTLGYNLLGIPLTEQILLKAGFDKTMAWTFAIELKGNLKLVYYLGEKGWSIGFKNYSDFSDLKYLHQLQNLYFALTGEELTINL